MVNDVKIKKCFMRKDQIQGTAKKMWFNGKIVNETVKFCIKTSESSLVLPQSVVQFSQTNVPLKGLRLYLTERLQQ